MLFESGAKVLHVGKAGELHRLLLRIKIGAKQVACALKAQLRKHLSRRFLKMLEKKASKVHLARKAGACQLRDAQGRICISLLHHFNAADDDVGNGIVRGVVNALQAFKNAVEKLQRPVNRAWSARYRKRQLRARSPRQPREDQPRQGYK